MGLWLSRLAKLYNAPLSLIPYSFMSGQASLFEIYGEHRELWDTHAGFYRDIDDLSQAWQPSPALLNTPLPLRSPLKPVFEHSAGIARSSKQSQNFTSAQTLTIDIPTRKIGLWGRLWRFIKFGVYIIFSFT